MSIAMKIVNYLFTKSDMKLLKLDTGDRSLHASIDRVRKHFTRNKEALDSTPDGDTTDENVDNIVSRLLSTPIQTMQSDAIDANELIVRIVN